MLGAYSAVRTVSTYGEIAGVNRIFFANSAWAEYADVLSLVSVAAPFLCFAVAAAIYLNLRWWAAAIPAFIVALMLFPLGVVLGVGTVRWYVLAPEADAA